MDGDEEGHGCGGETHGGELDGFLHVRQGTPHTVLRDRRAALHRIHRLLVTRACASNRLNIQQIFDMNLLLLSESEANVLTC